MFTRAASANEEFDAYSAHFLIAASDLDGRRHAFLFGALKMAQVLRDGPSAARGWMEDIEEFLREPDRCRCDACKQDIEDGTAFSPVAFLEQWIDEMRV
jgi:hypothetical protein